MSQSKLRVCNVVSCSSKNVGVCNNIVIQFCTSVCTVIPGSLESTFSRLPPQTFLISTHTFLFFSLLVPPTFLSTHYLFPSHSHNPPQVHNRTLTVHFCVYAARQRLISGLGEQQVQNFVLGPIQMGTTRVDELVQPFLLELCRHGLALGALVPNGSIPPSKRRGSALGHAKPDIVDV